MEDWLPPLQQGHSEVAWNRFLTRYRRLIFASIRHYTHDYDDGMDLFAYVCEKLRADKEMREVPVIIISAMNDEEIKRRAHEAGATAYFEKPFSPLALLKEIESLQRRSGQW